MAADFVLIPVKPSVADLLATEDAVVITKGAGTAFLCVFNDIGPKERVVDVAREALFSNGVPVADTKVVHRVAHIHGMDAGKSAVEVRVNGRRDAEAKREIEALWAEVKAAAIKAAKARTKAKAKAVAHG